MQKGANRGMAGLELVVPLCQALRGARSHRVKLPTLWRAISLVAWPPGTLCKLFSEPVSPGGPGSFGASTPGVSKRDARVLASWWPSCGFFRGFVGFLIARNALMAWNLAYKDSTTGGL